MEYAKKMVLVDPRVLQAPSTQPNPTSITQPESVAIDITLKGLDAGLQQILQRRDLPADEKVKLYSNYLQQYLTMRDKQTEVYRRPSQVSLVQPFLPPPPPNGGAAAAAVVGLPPPTAPPLPTGPDGIEMEVLQSVPKNLQKHAKMILERVKQNPKMGWTPQGELKVGEQIYPKSNMTDLVGDLLKKRKNFNPPGWETFSNLLYEGNIPQDLVRNPDRLKFMLSEQDKSATAAAVGDDDAELDAMAEQATASALLSAASKIDPARVQAAIKKLKTPQSKKKKKPSPSPQLRKSKRVVSRKETRPIRKNPFYSSKDWLTI